MMHGKPYFMENEEWYYFDKKECCYKLRPDAPKKAKESYEEFYKEDKKSNIIIYR